MTGILLDTHAWVWSMIDVARLSGPARTAIETSPIVYVSPVSFFEIGQKARLGKWPEIAPFGRRLPDLLHEQGGIVAPFTPEICIEASLMEWQHRDPFDRLLAATARTLDIPLVSTDTAFAEVPTLRRLW
ncbi:type II toxin-antitoxin system VapC family toxin [Pantanalinema rosaneae CENA516]|uniref:type II toxin-antitoxin system VapC family toxin n=1 Tax=Pantanalinema rosaneae TaxID=1620701 RepID=UPI003D6DBEFB